MSHLRFDGQASGLGFRTADGRIVNPYTREVVGSSESGDRNDASNYTVVCSCGRELGPLSRFKKGSDGRRACLCAFTGGAALMSGIHSLGDGNPMGCGRITLVGTTGQVEAVLEKAQVDAYFASREGRLT